MTISLQSETQQKANQRITFDSLRPIAQRAIKSLIRNMKFTGKYSLNLKEIEIITLKVQNQIKLTDTGTNND